MKKGREDCTAVDRLLETSAFNMQQMQIFVGMIKIMENNRLSSERMILEVAKKHNEPETFHIMPDLRGSNIFTTLDLAHGYLQIPLSEEVKAKTTFITPDETGQFEENLNIAINKTTNRGPFDGFYGFLPEFGNGQLMKETRMDGSHH
ncbi:hypothetical protein JTB14_020415 [Gonioctena quinquepunctata]|nr:hypothetical protein JTB14_020415 [Gonioctena quinquepunctata]